MPQVFSSCVTILAVFCSMLYLSFWLTLFVLISVVVIDLKTIKKSLERAAPIS